MNAIRAFALLFLMIALVPAEGVVLGPLTDWLQISDELSNYLFRKGCLAATLLIIVMAFRLTAACGLVARARWRTLWLYWPMVVILALIYAGGFDIPGPDVLLKIFLVAAAVGFSEELMFRGLVFHWFRRFSARTRILVSAGGFGLVHLAGLFSTIAPEVILAQAYFAFSLGLIFASARARDVSIWIPIIVHALFDFFALSAKGGISQTFEDTPVVVLGMLVAGTLALIWGLFLLWRTGRIPEQTKAQ